jgi:hypothetical protein
MRGGQGGGGAGGGQDPLHVGRWRFHLRAGRQGHTTRMQLAGRGITRGDTVGFEIFDKPNFGISDFIQRANYVRALQGELARTIGQLDDIESAGGESGASREPPALRQGQASDRLGARPVARQLRLRRGAIHSIRFLVANSVEGLKPNFRHGGGQPGQLPFGEWRTRIRVAGVTTTQLAARRNWSMYLAKKAEGMLETVLGPRPGGGPGGRGAQFRDRFSRIEEKFDPEGQVIRSQTRNDENNWIPRRPTPRRRWGSAANTPGARTLRAGPRPWRPRPGSQFHEEPEGSWYHRVRDRADDEQHLPGGRRHQAHLRRSDRRGAHGGSGGDPQGGAAHAEELRSCAGWSRTPWDSTRPGGTR